MTSSDPAPVVQLGEPMSHAMLEKRLEEKLPALAERMRSRPFKQDPHALHGSVVATRTFAREFIAEHPEIDGPVQIDCMWAEVLSPTAVDEILNAWPEATFFNLNDDAADAVAVVRDRRANGS